MEVSNLFAMLIANDVSQAAVVHALWAVFRIPDDLVDEIAEVKHEAELLVCRRALVFVNHAPIGILRTLIRILATDKCEARWARVDFCRRRDGAADAAAIAMRIDEAIPVDRCGSEAANEYARGPVRSSREGRMSRRNYPMERLIFRDLNLQRIHRLDIWRAPRPQQDAVRIRITRCNAFRKEVSAFVPGCRRSRECAAPGDCRSHCDGELHKRTSIHGGHCSLLALFDQPS